MDYVDPPNHAITWRVMTTIMGLEVISSVAITVAWLLGPFVDIIENFYNVPDCDFSCFRRVSNQLAVIKILCAVLYCVCSITALIGMYGFMAGQYMPVRPHLVMSIVRFFGILVLCSSVFYFSLGHHIILVANIVVLVFTTILNCALIGIIYTGYKLGRHKYIKPHVVLSLIRVVTVIFICCYMFHLTYGFKPIFVANWVVLLVSFILNVGVAMFVNIGYNLERNRNIAEAISAAEPLIRPFSGHYVSYGSFRSKAGHDESEEQPEPVQGEFFQRRPTGFPQASGTSSRT